MRVINLIFIMATCVACNTSKNTANNTSDRIQNSLAGNSIIAHRGAWKKNNLPENSIASLKQAIALKCYGSEFDVRMTADDSLIINHDTTYNKLHVEKTTYADLVSFKLSNGEKLPTLREYILSGLKNNKTTKLVCEIKPSALSKERGLAIATNVVNLVKELHAEESYSCISASVTIY